MRKTLEKIAKQKKVLSKSVLSAAKQLGLTQDQLAIVLNLDSVETLNSLELDPVSSQGELAIILPIGKKFRYKTKDEYLRESV